MNKIRDNISHSANKGNYSPLFGKKSGGKAVRITTAICFLLFSFLYLYHYQAPLLAMAQHVLSDGKTYYVPLVGALLITLVLFLLQLLVAQLLPLKSLFHALTYFPSLLILCIITDVSPEIDRGFSFGAWLWATPLLLVVWVLVSWIARAWEVYDSQNSSQGILSRSMWTNLLIMFLMFVLLGINANTDEVLHYRLRAEQCLVRGDYNGALAVGSNSLATDSSLTMLRIYALAAKGSLGERLFEYPLVGGSAAMRPNGTSVKMMLYTDSHLRRLRHSALDLMLCSYLLDRNLDAFASLMAKKYATRQKAAVGSGSVESPLVISASLPKHYREALILYCHLRSHPIVSFHDPVLDADYRDYQEMERNYSNPQERSTMLRDAYGKSYWYYYDYSQH